ncbi:MAG: serine hydrolase [Planctomycetota bacterium]
MLPLFHRVFWFSTSLVVACSFAYAQQPVEKAIDDTQSIVTAELYFPSEQDWDTVDFKTAGCDPDGIDVALKLAGEKHSKGVVILWRGRILAERYWDGWSQTQPHAAYSVSKSFVSSLVGTAITEGSIQGVDQSASDFLVEWRRSPEHRRITIHDLLSMSCGLEGGKANFLRGVLSQNERRFATSLPVRHAPGAHWDYHQSGYTLLHSILEEATNQPLQRYTSEKILEPIGMRHTTWATKRFNKRQTTFLRTTPRDAARYGLLVLAKGNWDGEQLIESSWLTKATRPANPTLNPSYGYLWWLNGGQWFWYPLIEKRQTRPIFAGCPDDTFAALGKDDQKIYVVPSLDLVVTRFGDAADSSTPALSEFDSGFLGAICRSLEPAVRKKPENK